LQHFGVYQRQVDALARGFEFVSTVELHLVYLTADFAA
jgi:hypothetical protein